MQFQLPANLREQVAVYDPALKAMINAQRAKGNPSKKSSTALGLPDDLFPVDVLPKEDQLAIVTGINRQPAAERHHFQTTDTHFCFIHHTDSMWLAFWHRTDIADLTSGDSKYIYGMSVAHKAAESVCKKVNRMCLSNYRSNSIVVANDPEKMEEVKYGRVQFLKRSILITLDDIQSGIGQPAWFNSLSSYGRNHEKYAVARQFTDSIRQYVPTWADDTSGVFARIDDKDKSVAKLLRINNSGTYGEYSWPAGNLTAEVLVSAHGNYFSSDVEFLSTPFFRREAQKAVEETNVLYHKKDSSTDNVKTPYELWKQRVRLASLLVSVYGSDTPVDYIQKMYQIGANLSARYPEESTRKWLKQNTPIASFIQWFERALKDQQKEWQEWPTERRERYIRSSSTGLLSFNFTEFNDTINMMNTLFSRQTDHLDYNQKKATVLDLKAPSRWRLSEFHDHISAKIWLTANKNEDMPQDLFPAPIKVEHLGSVWTFFQPRDIHQLGQWGQAVRNCVGNATNYREGVKKKTHFIVLAMIDQRPRFTMQLKVRNGVLEVDQIADIGNRRLDDNERSSYELTFSKALIMQNELLPAKSEVEM
jgi:hypothetical protein